MSQESSLYFAEVQRQLDELGQAVTLTADERDIVDDYAAQNFGPEACASHIAKARTDILFLSQL